MDRSYVQRLERMNTLTEPTAREAIDTLPIASGARGLDVGCGIGSHTRWLLEKVGDQGSLVGFDRCTDHLDVARKLTSSPGIEWEQGDLLDLPFCKESFDFTWCADTLWPGYIESPTDVLRRLYGILRPNGCMALWYWTEQALLCGYPALESRLRTAFYEATPYIRDVAPKQQVGRARDWLQAAGFEQIETRTFVRTLTGPLPSELRDTVHDAIDMLYKDSLDKVGPEDIHTYQRVAAHDAPEAVADDSAYFGWVLYTLHVGRRQPH